MMRFHWEEMTEKKLFVNKSNFLLHSLLLSNSHYISSGDHWADCRITVKFLNFTQLKFFSEYALTSIGVAIPSWRLGLLLEYQSFNSGIFQSSSAIPRTNVPAGICKIENFYFIMIFLTSITLGSSYSPGLLWNLRPVIFFWSKATISCSPLRFWSKLGLLWLLLISTNFSSNESHGTSISSKPSNKFPTGMFWSWKKNVRVFMVLTGNWVLIWIQKNWQDVTRYDFSSFALKLNLNSNLIVQESPDHDYSKHV